MYVCSCTIDFALLLGYSGILGCGGRPLLAYLALITSLRVLAANALNCCYTEERVYAVRRPKLTRRLPSLSAIFYLLLARSLARYYSAL